MDDKFYRQTIPIPGGIVNFLDNNLATENVVCFSHSILSSSSLWRSQAKLLDSLGYRVLLVDARGHGKSVISNSDFDLDDLCDDFIRILDHLKIENPHFVGVSLGGMIGIGLGIHAPRRIKSLMICDARADIPPEVRESWNSRIDLALRKGCAELSQSTLQRWFGNDYSRSIEEEMLSVLLGDIAETSVNGFVGCAKAIQALNYLPKIEKISSRTTLICGEQDPAFCEPMFELSKRIKNSVYHIVEGSGHLPNIQNPERFNKLLIEHLSKE